MKEKKRELQSETERLRQQLQVKEATLHSARAALAQAETRLNGEIQQLTAELSHERQRRRKRELELKHALAELAAIEAAASDAKSRGENTDEIAQGSATEIGDKSTGDRRWHFSSARKRRWKSL